MDSLTHALVAAIVAYSLGFSQFVPFIVIGAVIIDADVLFSIFSNRHPSLYLFVHGGIAHSIAGVVAMSAFAYAGIGIAALAGLVSPTGFFGAGVYGFAAILAGGFLHIAMDLPATPGIPLLAPFSDKKFALFILPGPSLFLLGVSLFFLIWLALGVVTFVEGMTVYMAIFAAFLLARFIPFLLSRPGLAGSIKVIPRVNPLAWLAIRDRGDSWEVGMYRIGNETKSPVAFLKFRDTTDAEIAPYRSLPEVKRLMYQSYIVTAKKSDGSLVLCDPLRESGLLFYPPNFKRVTIPLPPDTRDTA
ncbi:MAG: metal-dependent hydrolase [Methanoregula sp.]